GDADLGNTGLPLGGRPRGEQHQSQQRPSARHEAAPSHGRGNRLSFIREYIHLSPALRGFPAVKRLLCLLLLFAVGPVQADEKKPLRAGIIGLDTSHVTAFTSVLNADNPKPGVTGVRVVAAFPGGSPDVTASRTRVEGFTKTLREKYKVEIVSSIKELLDKVDVVLLESVDGRPHLEQVRPVLEARKPVFIDKPIAGSLADAIQIYELAKQHKVPVFSSSSLRYYPGVQAMRMEP